MEVLIVNQAEVPQLLPMKECVDVMARALAALSRGEANMPVRQILWLGDKSGALGLMPAHLTGQGAVGLKAVTFFPRNEGTDLDSHQGAVLLFEAGRGRRLRRDLPSDRDTVGRALRRDPAGRRCLRRSRPDGEAGSRTKPRRVRDPARGAGLRGARRAGALSASGRIFQPAFFKLLARSAFPARRKGQVARAAVSPSPAARHADCLNTRP